VRARAFKSDARQFAQLEFDSARRESAHARHGVENIDVASASIDTRRWKRSIDKVTFAPLLLRVSFSGSASNDRSMQNIH